MPGCGATVWCGGSDDDPLARPAPQHWCLRCKAQGGDTRSRRIEAHAHTILTLHGARRDITLDELRRELGLAGVSVAISTLHRFFARHGITRKKRPGTRSSKIADVLSQREARWSLAAPKGLSGAPDGSGGL